MQPYNNNIFSRNFVSTLKLTKSFKSNRSPFEGEVFASNLGKTTVFLVLPMAASLQRRVQFLKRFDFTLPLKMQGNNEQPVLSWIRGSGGGHSDLDCRIVSKKDFKTSFLGQEYLIV